MEGVELSNRGAQIVSPQSATTTAPPANMAPTTAAPESEESSDEEEEPPVTNPSTNIRVSTRQLPASRSSHGVAGGLAEGPKHKTHERS